MARGIYFNLVPTHCPPSSLCICAALASVIEATCGSFEKVKEGTDWRRKITGWEEWRKRRVADKEIGGDWFLRDICMSLCGWGCRRSLGGGGYWGTGEERRVGEREWRSERSERGKVPDRREGELEDHGWGSSASQFWSGCRDTHGYFLCSSGKEKPQRY